jgi:hypothetical protein
MSGPKLCRDCLHYAESYIAPAEHFTMTSQGAVGIEGYVFRRCTHPESIKADTDAVATGTPPDTRTARSSLGVCGLSGALFAQRPPKVPPPPEPPPSRMFCTGCGPLKDGERHRSILCRLVIGLDRDHPEHEEQKRLGGIFGRAGGIVRRGK